MVGRLCSREASDRHFHCAPWFATTVLASVSDSLVRVSRRGKENHLDNTQSNPSRPEPSDGNNQGWQRPDTAPPLQAEREVYLSQHWFPSLPFQQFQVLFNSLFKVLCIFPSRYLYAIGFLPIFSFGWNLPPALSCNPKQLDSSNTLLIPCQTGVSPSMLPYSKGLRLGLLSNEFISTTRRKVT